MVGFLYLSEYITKWRQKLPRYSEYRADPDLQAQHFLYLPDSDPPALLGTYYKVVEKGQDFPSMFSCDHYEFIPQMDPKS